jgi:hypothetical protein
MNFTQSYVHDDSHHLSVEEIVILSVCVFSASVSFIFCGINTYRQQRLKFLAFSARQAAATANLETDGNLEKKTIVQFSEV